MEMALLDLVAALLGRKRNRPLESGGPRTSPSARLRPPEHPPRVLPLWLPPARHPRPPRTPTPAVTQDPVSGHGFTLQSGGVAPTGAGVEAQAALSRVCSSIPGSQTRSLLLGGRSSTGSRFPVFLTPQDPPHFTDTAAPPDRATANDAWCTWGTWWRLRRILGGERSLCAYRGRRAGRARRTSG